MKKIIMIVLLAAGLQQVKAQQLSQVKPLAPLSGGLGSFKPETYSLKTLQQPRLDSLTKTQLMGLDDNAIAVNDRMPMVKTSNVDRMPVYNPDESGVKYTMLVKRVKLVTDADKTPVTAP